MLPDAMILLMFTLPYYVFAAFFLLRHGAAMLTLLSAMLCHATLPRRCCQLVDMLLLRCYGAPWLAAEPR